MFRVSSKRAGGKCPSWGLVGLPLYISELYHMDHLFGLLAIEGRSALGACARSRAFIKRNRKN